MMGGPFLPSGGTVKKAPGGGPEKWIKERPALSLKWSLLYRMTGTLWMGLGDHLFNNAVATNMFHVISQNEADSMQVVRVFIGQTLSFFLVAAYAQKAKKSIS